MIMYRIFKVMPKLRSTAKELKRKLNYFELLEYTTTALYV